MRVAALAPATQKIIESASIAIDVSASGGAVALADAVVAWAKEPLTIFYPTSDKGFEQPEQAEAIERLKRVGIVERHAVYRTFAPENLPQRLREAGPIGFLFYSPSAVENFVKAGGVPGAVRCIGSSTLRAYQSLKRADWPKPR